MKRMLGSVICLGLATICSAALLLGADDATGVADGKNPCTYKLSKLEFNSAGRTTFTLDVKPKRPDLVVTAWCTLQDEQQSIGRFALGNVQADAADGAVKFRIACLAKAYIDKSTIRVEIRDKKTNQQVAALELFLRDAVPAEAGTSVKQR